MKHTHPAITHPALRHRMAVALNQLRHENPYNLLLPTTLLDINNDVEISRYAARDACRHMAALEQALDDAQEARIFGSIPS